MLRLKMERYQLVELHDLKQLFQQHQVDRPNEHLL
jgi:hypothetical protein